MSAPSSPRHGRRHAGHPRPYFSRHHVDGRDKPGHDVGVFVRVSVTLREEQNP